MITTLKSPNFLTLQNPRHTWQSWRDRWVKSLKTLPRSTCIPQNAPPTPPAERTVDANEPPRVGTPQQAAYKPFTTKDAEDLLEVGDDIMNILPDRSDEAWLKWAEGRDVIFLPLSSLPLRLTHLP